MGKRTLNKKIFYDMILYFIGMIIPMLIGFSKMSIYTRRFSPEEYGRYSFLNITYTYMAIVSYSWLSNCIWRYYNKYKNEDTLDRLYFNVIIAFLISTVEIILISIIFILLIDNINIKLVYLFLIQAILMQLMGIYYIILRLEGKAKKYNFIKGTTTLISFLILLVLTFLLDFRISAFLISTIIIYSIISLLLIIFLVRKYKISKSYFSRDILRKFIVYGYPVSISNISFLILTSSDRYIIKMFCGYGAVGIYDQIYRLAEISVAAFVEVFFNSVNHILYNEMEINLKGYSKMLKRYINLYILLLLPVTVYFSMFSKEISYIFLGEEFRVGYTLMPYVMITSFIYGITRFIEDKLHFSNKIKITVYGFLIASILNILLNMWLVPIYGYEVAAITTLGSYIVLFIFYYLKEGEWYLDNIEKFKIVIKPIAIILVQVIINCALRYYFCFNVISTIFEGIVFTLIYLIYIKNRFKERG